MSKNQTQTINPVNFMFRDFTITGTIPFSESFATLDNKEFVSESVIFVFKNKEL